MYQALSYKAGLCLELPRWRSGLSLAWPSVEVSVGQGLVRFSRSQFSETSLDPELIALVLITKRRFGMSVLLAGSS